MKKIDWVRKLTSRKWWSSIAAFVTLMILAFGGSESTAAQVSAIIMAGAVVIGYTIGEGLADSAGQGIERIDGNSVEESEEA
jgi:hypothetical protein